MEAVERSKVGFTYLFECFTAKGLLKWSFADENLIPDAGRDYLLNAGLNGGAQLSSWYIGLYSGNYAPAPLDTAGTFPANATEITTAYAGDRHAVVPGALSAGVWANIASPAIFEFTADTTVRGGFITSVAAKGATTGLLLSAVLASSPKLVVAGESLKVTAGLSLVTV